MCDIRRSKARGKVAYAKDYSEKIERGEKE